MVGKRKGKMEEGYEERREWGLVKMGEMNEE